ncbi:MAG TPA: right-handed parallel beta-helix repeat-containing protein [Ferruginibacter sp.]|nr:right-handed parallel beta-helix repeat-containing protein [Ferruginibacter sp.]
MKTRFLFSAIIWVAFILMPGISFSQATRTWVSGVGDDINPGSRTAPCKTFAGAIARTATGGEINVLDAGGFGAVTITRSITIDGKGALAGILSSLTNGIIVNAPDAIVIIRNLSIHGAGNGINGIRIIAAKKVIVENCSIWGYTKKGIEMNTTSACTLILNYVTINTAEDAIAVTSPGGSVIMDNCKFQAVTNAGINLMDGHATVYRSNISACNIGIMAGAKTTVTLSNNIISNNETALQSSGTISSAGNNFMTGNKTQGTPTTVVKTQ